MPGAPGFGDAGAIRRVCGARGRLGVAAGGRQPVATTAAARITETMSFQSCANLAGLLCRKQASPVPSPESPVPSHLQWQTRSMKSRALGGAGAVFVLSGAMVRLPAAGPARHSSSRSRALCQRRASDFPEVLPGPPPGRVRSAPFSLLDYDSTRPWVRSIKEKVITRYMPPWHLDRSVGDYDPDPSLERRPKSRRSSKWVDQARRAAT